MAIPYMMFFFYSKADREYMTNIRTVRSFCADIINRRREEIRKNPEKVEDKCGDILTIMLQEGVFQDNNDAMIDEIITFFLAGSFTLKTTNSNLFMYLDTCKPIQDKLVNELKETVFKEQIENGVNQIDTKAALTIESVEQLKYFT